MSNESEIRKAIKIIANTESMEPIPATVKAVNGSTIDVEPLNGEPEILDVLLMSVDNGGFLLVPEVDDTVHVTPLDKDNYIVAMYGNLAKATLRTSETITLNSGDLGGLIIIEDLVKKVNNLESQLNDLAMNVQQHTHNVTAIAAPTGPSTPPFTNPPLIETQVSEIENPDITHGKAI